MISASPRNYGYVEVDRPVIEGGDDFLVQVADAGQQVLGADIVTSRTDYAMPDLIGNDSSETGGRALVFREPQFIEVPLSRPNLSVTENSSDLGMLLLHRAAPGDLASRFSFGYHAGRLMARSTTKHRPILTTDGAPRRAEESMPSLKQQLDEVSDEHQVDPEALTILCDRIDIILEPGFDIVVGLSPQSSHLGTLVLQRQAAISMQRLGWQSSKLTNPTNPGVLTTPFARVPSTISPYDYQRLFTKFEELVKDPIRLTLGKVRVSSSN